VIPPSSDPWWRHLPVVNATLNGTSAALLLCAFIMIKRRRVYAHATLMIAALVTSTAFLTFYLLHHSLKKYYEGSATTTFPPGPWRPWYLALLWPHLILAMVMLPLIFASVWLAWKRRWHLHHKVSSITFPLWFYVSISGVMVYWMLYHLAPTLRH
jgi:uncharacterized membrane protein YozB (DUF420 family)